MRRLTSGGAGALAAALAAAIIAAAAMLPRGAPTARAAAPGPVLPDMVDRDTVRAIGRGINYLVKTQRRDGSWLNSGGYGMYPAVMTSLASMALVAGGSTPESGPYMRNVTRGMNYLLRVAETHKDGLIAGPGGEGRSMYGHGFSMLFLAQCYGMELNQTYEKRLKLVLDRAVKLTAGAQSKVKSKAGKPAGGWYYTPSSSNDEGSVTVTQLQALRACRNVGIKVPRETIDKAVEYLRHCQQADGGICYSARSRGSSRPAISAAAIACFYAAGVYDRQAGGEGPEADMVKRLVDYVRMRTNPDRSGGHWFYTQFYLAQVWYQRGGKDWRDYYPRIAGRLRNMQAPDGSWNGDNVGTTYGTAIATIILQLPYGYLPICQR